MTAAAKKPNRTDKPAARPVTVPPRNKYLFAGLVTLAVMALASVFVYTAYTARQPENLLKRALAKTFQAKSAAIDLRINTRSADGSDSIFQLSGPLTVSGKFDLTGRYGLAAGGGLGLALRSADGKDAYVRLTDVNQLQQLLGEDAAAYGITADRNPLTGLEGKWLIVPASLKDTVLQNRPADGKADYELSDRERYIVAGLYRQHEFLKVGEVLPSERVNGVETHHYRLQLDAASLRSYLQVVQKEVVRLNLSDKQIGSIVSTAERITDSQVWLGKPDNRIHKLRFEANGAGQRQTIELGLRDFDQPVKVERPAGAEPLFEVLTGLAGNGLTANPAP